VRVGPNLMVRVIQQPREVPARQPRLDVNSSIPSRQDLPLMSVSATPPAMHSPLPGRACSIAPWLNSASSSIACNEAAHPDEPVICCEAALGSKNVQKLGAITVAPDGGFAISSHRGPLRP